MQELLTAILHGFTLLYGPLVIVLDDIHHFDTASWQLLVNVTQHATAVLVVAALRPSDGMLAPIIITDVRGHASDSVLAPILRDRPRSRAKLGMRAAFDAATGVVALHAVLLHELLHESDSDKLTCSSGAKLRLVWLQSDRQALAAKAQASLQEIRSLPTTQTVQLQVGHACSHC